MDAAPPALNRSRTFDADKHRKCLGGMAARFARRGSSYHLSAAISYLPRVVGQFELQVWAETAPTVVASGTPAIDVSRT